MPLQFTFYPIPDMSTVRDLLSFSRHQGISCNLPPVVLTYLKLSKLSFSGALSQFLELFLPGNGNQFGTDKLVSYLLG